MGTVYLVTHGGTSDRCLSQCDYHSEGWRVNLELTFSGTSAGRPTADRTVSGLLFERAGERVLIDPGEGTQQQMIEHGTKFDIDTILLTHLHADHTLGVAGLFHSWNFSGRTRPANVIVPQGGRLYVNNLRRIVGGTLPFEVHISQAVPSETVITFDRFQVQATEVDHSGPAVGYEFVEDDRPGKFDQAEVRRLGIDPGPKFDRLQRGGSVKTEDGMVIRPDQLMGRVAKPSRVQ